MITTEQALYTALKNLSDEVLALGFDTVDKHNDLFHALEQAIDILGRIAGLPPLPHVPNSGNLSQTVDS